MSTRTTIVTAAALAVIGLVATTPLIAAPPAPDGAALFRARCVACHAITPGAAATIAPNLAGVVGRKAASTAFRYSDALKGSGKVWTRASLDTFLAAPMQVVPGTRMVIKVADPAERAAIIDYLAKTKG